MLYSRVGSWPNPQTLDCAVKAASEKRSSLLRTFVNYGRKSLMALFPVAALDVVHVVAVFGRVRRVDVVENLPSTAENGLLIRRRRCRRIS